MSDISNFSEQLSLICTRKRQRLSELELSEKAGLSRQSLNLELALLSYPAQEECHSDFSTIAVSSKVVHDGFDSWKLHFFDFVDEFRRSLDTRLIILPPSNELDLKLKALLHSLVEALCEELKIPCPDWALKNIFLERPWFLSGMESLKASALLESPLSFKRNNIYVLENFLKRA